MQLPMPLTDARYRELANDVQANLAATEIDITVLFLITCIPVGPRLKLVSSFEGKGPEGRL